MDAMNGRVRDGYPPRCAPAAGLPLEPDAELLAAIVATVREVRELDATIAAADADLARLPTLLAWLVRVRHPVLWLVCVPRHQATAALALPAARQAPPAARRWVHAALLLAVVALLLVALLAAAGMDVLGEVLK